MVVRRIKCYLSLSALLTALFAIPAGAATRTVYFNATGVNRTNDGLSTTATSSCKIIISNPSQPQEDWTLNIIASSIDHWLDDVTVRQSATALTTTGGACTGTTCSGSLNKGDSVTISYPFNSYPARDGVPAVQSSYQDLRCSGSITATDHSSGQPGYLLASGLLVTFVESSKMATDASSTGSLSQVTFGGIAVYTQIPIPINRSKPF